VGDFGADSLDPHLPGGLRFALASCQFALHYSFASEARARMLLEVISRTLPDCLSCPHAALMLCAGSAVRCCQSRRLAARHGCVPAAPRVTSAPHRPPQSATSSKFRESGRIQLEPSRPSRSGRRLQSSTVPPRAPIFTHRRFVRL
jgi:hypothetical protein